MKLPDVAKTIRSNNLCLQSSVLIDILKFLFRILIKSLFILITGILLLDAYFTESDKTYGLILLLVVVLIVGAILTLSDYRLYKLPLTNIEQFRKTIPESLSDIGFTVLSNNSKYIAATRTKNRTLISDDFYAIFNGDYVLIACICELPFPLSYLSFKKITKSVKARCNVG